MPVTEATIETILERLHEHYPEATYELEWTTPEEMLVATTLAAQCTDERVNRVTRTLFKKYPNPKAWADAPLEDLEVDLKPTGFYRQKAKAVKALNQALVEKFDSKIPQDIKKLITVRGVARKTANVVLNCCFDIASGIIVDTHVARLSQRMGHSTRTKADQIERDLMKIIPQEAWTFWGPAMVLHGRYVCKAKAPNCAGCIFLDLCPRNGVTEAKPTSTTAPPKVVPKGGFVPRPGIPSPPATRKKPSQKPGKAAAGASGGAERSVAALTAAPSIDAWVERLGQEMDKPYFAKLMSFVDGQRAAETIFPPEDEVFTAFNLTPFEDVKVLVLGQDPYHDHNQAHGLSFSVKPGIKIPPSLRNIYKEYEEDTGLKAPSHGYLEDWAKRGVMMLNAVLTVQAHKPNSHKNQGWETFTDAVIRKLSDERQHVVFLLWGGYARKKKKLIDKKKHTIIESAHPSPLSARAGFFGSKPFSKINAALQAHGQDPIDWSLS